MLGEWRGEGKLFFHFYVKSVLLSIMYAIIKLLTIIIGIFGHLRTQFATEAVEGNVSMKFYKRLLH